jgi:hypothetical protein
MKTLTLITGLLLITISLFITVSAALAQSPWDFTGEIVFKDGTKIEYIGLSGTGFADDRFEYSKKMKGPHFATIRLSDIARMDFIEITEIEKKYAKKYDWSHKAKITFRDGTVWDNIYLFGSGWGWRSKYDEGDFEEAEVVSGMMMSITFNLKTAMTCPKCSRQFRGPDWKFCPFDGTALK